MKIGPMIGAAPIFYTPTALAEQDVQRRMRLCAQSQRAVLRATILVPPRKTVSSIQMTRCATNFTSSPLVKMAAKPASLAAALGATQATPAPASNPRRHASKTSYPS